METIEVRGVEYKLVKARDFEVIVRSDNDFINYTKLCQQINDNRRPFSQLKKSETFQRLCIQMEEPSGRIRPDGNEPSLYEQIKNRIEIEITGGDRGSDMERIRGTYMPRYLLDYVIMTCDIGYYKLVHELMDSIDAVAQERQRSFIEELQSNISEQHRKLERKKLKISRLEEMYTRLQATMDEVRNENAQTHQRLDQANEQLTTVHGQLDQANEQLTTVHGQLDQANERLQTMSTVVSQVAEHLEESSKFVTENFNERNMTLGHVQEVIAIFSIKTFTDSQRLPDGFAVYDIFAGNPRFLRKTMLKRKYKPTEDELEHPVAVIDTSDAKDLLNYVRNNIDREFAAISPDSKLITNDIEATVKYITICKDKMVTLDRDAVSLHLSNLKNALRSALRDGLREVHERIDRIEANQNRIIDLLTRRRPNATKVLVNGRYRDLMFRNDGTVLYIPRANHREVELTEDDINRLRFKDNDGRNIELM